MTVDITYVDPAELRPADYNPRTISDAALGRLAGLLETHGFVDPIIARRADKLVIGGHQRLRANAMRAEPDERVPVVFLDGISDAEAKALNVALNNAEAQGRYDDDRLADLLAELSGEIDVAPATGFTEKALAELTGEMPELDDAPEIPPSYQVVVECTGEDHQRELYDRLTGEGLRCRLLML
ncbi:MAG: ParB/RepB/Spo0J family partition protein [Planctomycetota bacterium]